MDHFAPNFYSVFILHGSVGRIPYSRLTSLYRQMVWGNRSQLFLGNLCICQQLLRSCDFLSEADGGGIYDFVGRFYVSTATAHRVERNGAKVLSCCVLGRHAVGPYVPLSSTSDVALKYCEQIVASRRSSKKAPNSNFKACIAIFFMCRRHHRAT